MATATASARWSEKPLPVPLPDSDDSVLDYARASSRKPTKDAAAAGKAGARKSGWHASVGRAAIKKLHKEFGGSRGFDGRYTFRRPSRQLTVDVEKDILFGGTVKPSEAGEFAYLNSMGQTIWKRQDVDTYLSTTTYEPRRLLVQAAPHVLKDPFLQNTDWRRRAISGSVPTVLRLAEWALRPGDRNPENGRRSPLGVFLRGLRILLVGVPLQIMLAFPGVGNPWEEENEVAFIEYPGYHWFWPKHAINPLDRRPVDGHLKPSSKPLKVSSRSRLTRPRRLVVYRGDDRWATVEDPSPDIPYIFVSFTTLHFDINRSEDARRSLERMAAYVTLDSGCSAFWLDYRCCASDEYPQEKTADINRICDVIRSAHQVVAMLPDQRNKPNPKSHEVLLQEWGGRMWTLPEGLLAPQSKIQFCYTQDDGSFGGFKLHKLELTERVWKDDPADEEDPPSRILAEHYTSTLTLSRLELFSTALRALCDRESSTNLYTDADLSYALMGLLHHRIEPDASDSLFQALARLSLSNDSDRLIERMICMYPTPYLSFRRLFELLNRKDQYETHLWDIHPMCEVVGVCDEPSTVLINNCKAIPIRWKTFPRMKYQRHYGVKKALSELFVRSGAWWFVSGVALAYTYAPILVANSRVSNVTDATYAAILTAYLAIVTGAFFAMGFVLSAFGPHSVRRLFGGAVLQSSPHLVGFEGVMPIRDLEKIVFGNWANRLSYEASSTPYILNHRHPERREGIEPAWIRDDPGKPDPPVPVGQRLFTLVDTNSLAVSIFTAQRPPTVALICGREGGMLRTVLCSWKFSMDCLFREAVIRLPHDTWDIAKMPSWLKLSLGNQEDLIEGLRWQRNELWRKRASGGTALSFGAKSSKTTSFQKPPSQKPAPPRGRSQNRPQQSQQSGLQQQPSQQSQQQQQQQPPPRAPQQPQASAVHHQPQQAQSPISPPVSMYSTHGPHRGSNGQQRNGLRQSSAPGPRASLLKAATGAAAASASRPGPQAGSDGTPAPQIYSPSPQRPPPQAATLPAGGGRPNLSMSTGYGEGQDEPFVSPTSTDHRPVTFLAPITPTTPFSTIPSPAQTASPPPQVPESTAPPATVPPPLHNASAAAVPPPAQAPHGSAPASTAAGGVVGDTLTVGAAGEPPPARGASPFVAWHPDFNQPQGPGTSSSSQPSKSISPEASSRNASTSPQPAAQTEAAPPPPPPPLLSSEVPTSSQVPASSQVPTSSFSELPGPASAPHGAPERPPPSSSPGHREREEGLPAYSTQGSAQQQPPPQPREEQSSPPPPPPKKSSPSRPQQRSQSPGGAGLLRPAQPSRERSSPALEPGRVDPPEEQLSATELDAPKK